MFKKAGFKPKGGLIVKKRECAPWLFTFVGYNSLIKLSSYMYVEHGRLVPANTKTMPSSENCTLITD